jgi:adenosine deaminase
MSVTTQRTPRAQPPDLAYIRAMPKVELHVHVEGAAAATTVADLAARNGIDLGVTDPADLYRYRNLADFLRVFDLVCRVLVHEDDIRRVTYEALQIASAAGVRYREMFFSPTFLLRHGVSFDTIWAGLEQGVRDAEIDFDIRCRLIMDVDKPSGPAAAMALFALADRCDRDVLIGVGGDAGEVGIDLAGFAAPFQHARSRGWRTTMHLGEEGPASDIRAGVHVLGLDRVDHGVSLVSDPALMADVAARRIAFTCCPTSNVSIGVVRDVAAHPIATMRDAGVLVTVNSDNAEMFGVDMADELHSVASAFGWGVDAIEDLCLAGVEACWAPVDEQRKLRSTFEAHMDQQRVDAGLPPRSWPRAKRERHS